MEQYTDENYILQVLQEKEGWLFKHLVYVGTEKTVHVPAELENDNGCFQDNEAIEEIIYTSGNKVADGFHGCSQLRRIYFSETIERLGWLSFFRDCDNLTDIEVDPANPFFTAKKGMIFSKNEEKLIYCAPGIKGVVAIPATVKKIGHGAFEHCKGIESVILPERLTTIESSAFAGCSGLININLPESLNTIPEYCFSGCSGLETVDLSHVESIEQSAFSGCEKLKIVITANVGYIGYGAFSGCDTAQFVFEEPDDGLTAENMYGETIFGSSITVGEELRTYPNLPLELFAKPDLKQWLVMGFCSAPELYSGYIRKQYEKYAKSQKNRILKRAMQGGYDKVLAYYGESAQKKSTESENGDKQISLSMTAAEAKKLFKYSNLTSGISIKEFKGVSADWKSQGNYDSHFLSGVSNWLVLPETIDGIAVGHIAHTMLPDDAVIICSNLVFRKLKRPVRVSTACAYLEEPDKFPAEEAEEIQKFIAKYPSDTAEKLLPMASVQALTRFTETAKITTALRDEMLEKTAGKAELAAIILNLQIEKKAGKKSQKADERDAFSEMMTLEEKPMPVSELKKMWLYWVCETLANPGDKFVVLTHYKGTKNDVVVPSKFGKNRLGRIEGALLEGHDDVSSLTLPDGEYEIDITLKNCKKLADPQGFIVVRAGERVILTDYIQRCNDSFSVPEGITEIGREVFKNRSVGQPVREIIIPAGCNKIGNLAFSDCDRLQRVVFQAGVETVNLGCLTYCKMLKDLYIPASVVSVSGGANYCGVVRVHGAAGSEAEAFAKRENLKFIEQAASEIREPVPDFVVENGVLEKYFGQSGVVIVPEGVRSIGRSAFDQCDLITEIQLPGTVEEIEDYAVYAIWGLKKVKLSKGLQRIGNCAFACNDNLAEVRIPDGVTSLGEGAFSGCSNLKTVYVPASVREIGDKAFPEAGTEIRGVAGSFAQKYATENNLPFEEE